MDQNHHTGTVPLKCRKKRIRIHDGDHELAKQKYADFIRADFSQVDYRGFFLKNRNDDCSSVKGIDTLPDGRQLVCYTKLTEMSADMVKLVAGKLKIKRRPTKPMCIEAIEAKLASLAAGTSTLIEPGKPLLLPKRSLKKETKNTTSNKKARKIKREAESSNARHESEMISIGNRLTTTHTTIAMKQDTLQKNIDAQTQLLMRLADSNISENVKVKLEEMLKKYEAFEKNLNYEIGHLLQEAAYLRSRETGLVPVVHESAYTETSFQEAETIVNKINEHSNGDESGHDQDIDIDDGGGKPMAFEVVHMTDEDGSI